MKVRFNIKDFLVITLIMSIWVNISENIRFFAYVEGKIVGFLHMVPNIGLLWDPEVLAIFAVWSLLLSAYYVFIFWLCAQVFGNGVKAIIVSSLTSVSFIVLFWLLFIGMQLGEWDTFLTILPFALLETFVASFIASRLYAKKGL